MFKVEENLLLTKNQLNEDCYVLEDCSSFFPELSGFYVCVPKENADVIKNYMRQQPNSGFVVKTYEDDMVNGLKLLLRMEQLSSYTELFVKYYGGINVILDTFSTLYAAEPAQEQSEESDTSKSNEVVEDTGDDVSDTPGDYIDDSMFEALTGVLNNSAETSDDNREPTEEVSSETQESNQDTDIPEGLMNAQTEELYLMIRGIACKLGVIDYDDSHTLSKADMKNAQIAIKTLSAMTVQEGMLGALALAETKEDLGAITRFLELFYTYLRENGLSR